MCKTLKFIVFILFSAFVIRPRLMGFELCYRASNGGRARGTSIFGGIR